MTTAMMLYSACDCWHDNIWRIPTQSAPVHPHSCWTLPFWIYASNIRNSQMLVTYKGGPTLTCGLPSCYQLPVVRVCVQYKVQRGDSFLSSPLVRSGAVGDCTPFLCVLFLSLCLPLSKHSVAKGDLKEPTAVWLCFLPCLLYTSPSPRD